MKVIVITGSSRGIGYGLADAFLALGCQVVITGRNLETLNFANQKLAETYRSENILAIQCDVRDYQQVKNLWDQTKKHFQKVDLWINNAGTTQIRYPIWQQPSDIIQSVIDTNLTGSVYGAKIAIQGMIEQGFGAVYFMEGEGSSGTKRPTLSLYGTTKYAVRYLTEALVKETQKTPIIIGAISPGIVVTDLLTGQYDESQKEAWEKVKNILNILADRIETVTPWLATRILANQKTGVRIAWLTLPKVIFRFIKAFLGIKRNVFLTQ
jgi:NADP-dependent 3-hydroxy acid dehydrogenase YdfG